MQLLKNHLTISLDSYNNFGVDSELLLLQFEVQKCLTSISSQTPSSVCVCQHFESPQVLLEVNASTTQEDLMSNMQSVV